jgi:hypothetical protein
MASSGNHIFCYFYFTSSVFCFSHAILIFSSQFAKFCLDIYVKKTKITEITGGKIDFEIMARVINLWTTPDRANSAEGGAIHMILLDKDVCCVFSHTICTILTLNFVNSYSLCMLFFTCAAWKNSCNNS